MSILSISGKVVRRSNGQPIPGLSVEAWDRTKQYGARLGDAVSDNGGSFTITLNRNWIAEIFNDRLPDIYFRILSGPNTVASTEDSCVVSLSGEPEPVTVSIEYERKTEAKSLSYIVTGTILEKDYRPAAGYRVEVMDKGIINDTVLAQATTGEGGEFRTAFEAGAFEKSGKQKPDLFLRVSNKKEIALTSAVVYNAPSIVEFREVIGGKPFPVESEFERLGKKLQPFLRSVSIQEIKGKEERNPFLLLAQKTGEGETNIRYYIAAHQLAAETKTPPEFSYAMLRGNFSADPVIKLTDLLKVDRGRLLTLIQSFDRGEQPREIPFTIDLATGEIITTLVSISDEAIRNVINAAIRGGVIPASFEASREQAVNNWASFKESYTDADQKDFQKLVEGTGLKAAEKKSVAALYRRHGSDFDKLLEEAESGKKLKGEGLDELEAVLKVHAIVGDAKLASELSKNHRIRESGDVRKLARWSKEQWKEAIGKTNEKGADAKADSIMTAIREEYPTTAFVGHLERDKKAPVLKTKKNLIAFLDAYGDMELHKTNFDLLFHKEEKSIGRKFGDTTALKTELKKVQRVFKLAPDYEKAKVLLEKDIHSSQAIYRMGKKQFVDEVSGGAISKPEAKKIYRTAERSYAATLAMLGEIKSLEQGSAFKVLPDVEKTYNALKHSTMKDFPDWKTIFTSPDICECEECRSVYSPAAYLSDVLTWLNKRGSSVPGKTARDIFFERRPDIGEIDLNCDNSNVAIPYTDLVSEVLEDRLAHPVTVVASAIEPLFTEGQVNAGIVTELVAKGLELDVKAVVTKGTIASQWFLRDKLHTYEINKNGGQLEVSLTKQTHGSAAERKAMPEYINYNAYDTTLKNSLTPITLPFDLSWEETRAYLDKIQVDRSEWMEAFQNRATANPAAGDIESEYLGLSPKDRSIIATIDTPSQSQYWGGLTKINEVDIFLQKAEIEYKQLIDLLRLKFINPLLDSKIDHGDTTCDTSTKTITNLDNNKLDRINRFLRLWKKLGWQMWELDAVIMNSKMGNGLLNLPFLIRLKYFVALQRELKLSVEELLAYYGDLLTTGGTASHYQKLFRNKVILDPLPDAFKLELVTQNPFVNPAPADRTLTGQSVSLAAALRIKQENVAEISTGAALADNNLSLANISTIYRVASLTRKLKLTVPEFYLLNRILNTGAAFDVFQSPAKTLEFIKLVRLVRSSRFSVYELLYILMNMEEGPKPFIPTDDKIALFITAGRAALQKIEDDLSAISGTPDEIAGVLFGKISYTDAAGNVVSPDTDTINGLTQVFNGTYTGTTVARDTFLDATFPFLSSTATIKTALNNRDAAPANLKDEKTGLAYETVNALLKEYLGSSFSRQAVYQLHADNFKISETLSHQLLESIELPAGTKLLDYWFDAALLAKDPLTGLYLKAITTANFPGLFKSYLLINKIVLLYSKMPFNSDMLDLLFTNAADFGVLAYDSLPVSAPVAASNFDQWKDLVQLFQFSVSYPDSEDGTLAGVLRKALPLADTEANFLQALSVYTLWDAGELTKLKTQMGFVFANDYRSVKTYVDLDIAMSFLVTTTIQAAQVPLLIKTAPLAADAIAVKQVVKSKYDNLQWLDTSANIQGGIRERKRDALIAYFTHHTVDGNDFKDSNELYSYYLLDVEMGSAEVTTRILQAYLSAQLFVQRCLMNLEADVSADETADDGWRQWAWMKNYRVWEANRKVFLYPENWIEPELRLDKSYFFKELENDLMQNEINQVNVENAYLAYLEKLDNVARLDVCGYYYEQETYTLHVFARTYDDPNLYYYRKWIEDRYWTPWEKVDLEINATHVVPIVINQRVYLYWPDFREVSVDSGSSRVPAQSDQGKSFTTDKPQKHWEIHLAVSEFRNKKWTPKKISKTFIETPNGPELTPREYYSFIPLDLLEINGTYLIGCFLNTQPNTYWDYSYKSVEFFDLGSCKGTPERMTDRDLIGLLDQPLIQQFARGELMFLESQEAVYNDTPDPLYFQMGSLINGRSILDKTPGRFRAPIPAQLGYADKFVVWLYWSYMQLLNKNNLKQERGWPLAYTTGTFLPFFYEDKQRTFFVQHELILRERKKTKKDKVKPAELFYSDIVKIIEDFLRTGELNALIKPFFENGAKPDVAYRLKFNNFYHPHVCFLLKQYYKSAMESAAYAPDGSKYTLDGFFRREVQLLDKTKFPEVKSFSFKDVYNPYPIVNPGVPAPTDPFPYYPKEEIDFAPSGSYSDYNWELFFHAPLMLAERLSSNQRFEEAMHWFHYIFNPTDTSANSSPQKFWVTKPFFLRSSQDYIDQRIDNILTMINNGDTEMIRQVDDWRKNAFQPHLIAKFRTVAYQKTVVMKYLDNLIAWGDNLFRSDRREAIGEATQLYILAAEILGPKPRVIPKSIDPVILNYNQLEPRLDEFSNAMVEMENFVPYMAGDVEEFDPGIPLPSLETYYYCIPQNDKMMEYWDTVGDRLFKIRHSMNIEGIERQLALFDPPIDPGLLVRAVASGVSLSAAISGLDAPLPYYRFQPVVQKAMEICNEVKSLGGALLTALEKKDAEAIALLRSTQEIRLLEAVKLVKQRQINEAKENIEVLNRTKNTTEEKRKYYASLAYMNAGEIVAFSLSTASTVLDAAIAAGYILAGGLKAIPQFVAGGSGFGGSPHVVVDIGGTQFGDVAEAATKTISAISHALDKGASLASTQGSYQRRQDEWNFQKLMAEKELLQMEKQISAAQIRLAIAEKELENQDLQIENAKATDEFMKQKFTNKELYDWMIGQISAVYFQTYQLAYDMAKKSERCYRYELGLTDSSFIQFGYWDSLKKGLLTGEKLALDIKRMESSWIDHGRREFEITRHISLAQLDPMALIRLKQNGECFFQLPEEIYDIDYPGHYFRRIKSAGISIPCIIGPYNNVNCTLTILKSRIRISPDPAHVDYSQPPAEDDPGFTFNFSAIQSIATSSGQNDSGLFETNLKDERYLPFEGHGAISEWKLEMNKDFKNFDFETISDVVLHIRYTARQGGKTLATKVKSQLSSNFGQIIKTYQNGTGFYKLVSMKTDFPTEFYRLTHGVAAPHEIDISFGSNQVPYWLSGKNLEFDDTADIQLVYLKPRPGQNIAVAGLSVQLNGVSVKFTPPKSLGDLKLGITTQTGALFGNWKISSGANVLDPLLVDDILMLIKYKIV